MLQRYQNYDLARFGFFLRLFDLSFPIAADLLDRVWLVFLSKSSATSSGPESRICNSRKAACAGLCSPRSHCCSILGGTLSRLANAPRGIWYFSRKRTTSSAVQAGGGPYMT